MYRELLFYESGSVCTGRCAAMLFENPGKIIVVVKSAFLGDFEKRKILRYDQPFCQLYALRGDVVGERHFRMFLEERAGVSRN